MGSLYIQIKEYQLPSEDKKSHRMSDKSANFHLLSMKTYLHKKDILLANINVYYCKVCVYTQHLHFISVPLKQADHQSQEFSTQKPDSH